jgi:hypothetical protein
MQLQTTLAVDAQQKLRGQLRNVVTKNALLDSPVCGAWQALAMRLDTVWVHP